MKKAPVAFAVVAALAAPALAFHRQTPPIVALTTSGDNSLPRVPTPGHRLVLHLDASGDQVFRQNRAHNLLEQVTSAGRNDNPTISSTAGVLAWDSDCAVLPSCPDPGRQIFMWAAGITSQVTHDPTGTSVNPVLSGKGTRLAFESRGDLAGTGNAGVLQVFLRAADGTISQGSHGNGTSRNAALDRGGTNLSFESTSSQAGDDTGVSQIWLLSRESLGQPAPVTNGEAPSTRPAISGDGRVVAFESRAALTGDGHDTGLTQIYAFDVVTRALSQITEDPEGCAGASVDKVAGDWRIGFVCHGEGFFHQLRARQRYRLPIDGGDTAEAVAELGRHFFVVSTTANLLGSGATPGHQLYMLNLFKLPAQPVD